MITKIEIAKCASYPETVQVIEPLACNYLFGFNGSGKSTVARLIKDESHPDFDCSSVKWQNNNPLEVQVYNRDFIRENYDDCDDLKGVFTLGKGAKDAKAQIAEKKRQEGLLVSEIGRLEVALEAAQAGLLQAEQSTEKAFWETVTPRKSVFSGAFAGGQLAGMKAFMEEVLRQRSNTSELKELAYLQDKAKVVFAASADPLPPLPPIGVSALVGYEQEPLLKTKIIASGDVPIAALIEKMNNSDWLRQGRRFIEHSEGKCPYCQQDLPDDLEAQMDVVFSAEFTRLSNEFEAFVGKYQRAVQDVRDVCELVLAAANPYLDEVAFRSRLSALELAISTNLASLKEKQDEPSRVAELGTLAGVLEEMQALVTSACQKTDDYNKTVADLDNQKNLLTKQIWRYLVAVELKPLLDKYDADKKAKTDEIVATEGSLTRAKGEREVLVRDMKALQEQVTDVGKVLNDINRLLKSFGFTGFSLSPTKDGKGYEIIRGNGTPAKENLSEGERSFITFLYFYHLIDGSLNSDAAMNNKVVVFDDPVSSMDSEVLFIVSTLIRETCEKVSDPKSHIKQVFVLTHNVYFHNEVSFKRTKKARDAYWIVRKPAETTQVIPFGADNPVKSSYQLLWDEIGVEKPSPATVQNNVRRILEYYFQFNGSTDIKKVADKFADDDPDKKTVLSMVSWLHAGSHTVADDITYSLIDDDTVAKYLVVFRRVFDVEGHINHYGMMCSGDMRERYEADGTEANAGTEAGAEAGVTLGG